MQVAPTPRRVLMTADTIGGVWTYALELARAMEPFGIEFTIASMGAWLRPEQVRETRALPNVEICESNFKLEWMADPWRDVQRAGEWLLGLAAERNPDLIHLNGYAHGALDWPAPVLIVAHSCVLSWWEAVKGERAPAEWQHYQTAVGRGIRTADHLIAPSQAMLQMARRHYGPLPPSHVIYNARDAELYKPRSKKEFILTAGRFWDEAKNIAVLGSIARELPWPVHVAGETKSPDGSECTLQNVLPLGKLSSHELAPWFGHASIYALPALYEPFGLSILEAALAGCALVLGDIPSLREVWEDAAVFVNPRDNAALSSALNSLIENPNLLHKISARANERAHEFNPRRMAEAYHSVYAQHMRPMDQNQQQELVLCES